MINRELELELFGKVLGLNLKDMSMYDKISLLLNELDKLDKDSSYNDMFWKKYNIIKDTIYVHN